jgi:hypothetical protein
MKKINSDYHKLQFKSGYISIKALRSSPRLAHIYIAVDNQRDAIIKSQIPSTGSISAALQKRK